ncbi:MAG: CotH kinase family protein [Bacillota bacterium]|nr:CotH kinase family protein [Bacillota bacterium]
MVLKRFLAILITILMLMSGITASAVYVTEFNTMYTIICKDGVPCKYGDKLNTARVGLSNRYMFLPAAANLQAVPLYFNLADGVTANINAELKNGKSLPIKSGDTVNIKLLFELCNVTDNKYPLSIKTSNGISFSFTIMQSENLPSMYICTTSGTLSYVHAVKGNEESGTVCMLSKSGDVIYNGDLNKIKGRGNASWGGGGTSKKPYNITIGDKAELILGSGKTSKWSLLNSGADLQDETYFANQMVMASACVCPSVDTPLASEMIELYIDGDYRGLYELTEKIDIGKATVDIKDQEKFTDSGETGSSVTVTEANDLAIANGVRSYKYWSSAAYKTYEPDLTGGYIVEGDGYYEKEGCGFRTAKGIGFSIKRPEYATKEQVRYIANYVQDYENALFSPTGYNDKGRHYTDYADLKSLAARFVLENFFYCREQLGNSTYIYKDTGNDTKLHFGPMWDYENVMSSLAWQRNGAKPPENPYDTLFSHSTYGNCLVQKGDFMSLVYDINKNELMPLMSTFLAPTAKNGEKRKIDSLYDMIEKFGASAKMDNLRWGKTSWESEISRLESWLGNRINYWAGQNGVTGLFDSSYLRGANAYLDKNTINVSIRGTAQSYKWYKLSTDKKSSQLIMNVIGSSYTPDTNGIYYAVVTGATSTDVNASGTYTLTSNPVEISLY